MGIKDFFQKKGQDASDEEADQIDDAAPTGAPVVQGKLRTSGAAAAASLRKKPIAAAVAGLVILFGGVSYGVYDLSTGGTSSTSTPKVHSSSAPIIRVPHLAPPKAPAPKAVPTTPSAPAPAQVPTQSTAPVATAAPTPAPNYTQQNHAAESQLTSMISGTDTGSTGWKTGSSAAAKPTAALPTTAAETLPKVKSDGVYSTHLVRKEASPYELLQGTVIPAVMETGIKSDLPGMITAVVNQPVYSSVSGASVLIPAGSKLIGEYQSKTIAGDTRVGVIWSRILFPNGTYIQIGKSEGYSPKGYAGFHDLVNDHTWTIFKNAMLLSLIDVGMSIASPSTSTSTNGTSTGNTDLQDGEQSLAQTFGQAEASMFQKDISIAPTLTIRPGYAFNVIVGKDLIFPGPYKHSTQLENQEPMPAAMPTMANPYG